ncbi:hypothetical protein [Escherichia coli]|uniref:hypothetical protein n=1 Tax=Escherichia coli TaxID=562 RepID=UPI0021BEEBE0|nr:hypothetical protein [Escherichia coli]
MTTFTNSKLTDEYVSNATLIRLILWADQHNSHYVVAALRELQERRKADSVPVEINDDMAYAFHHALSDSSLGSDEIEEIKTGLRAAFANVAVQPALIVPAEIEPDDSNTFDYVDGWNACRDAMLQGAEPVQEQHETAGSACECRSNEKVQALQDGWVAVPILPTTEMIYSGITAHYERSQIQIHDRPAPGPMECAYMAMLAAAPQQELK